MIRTVVNTLRKAHRAISILPYSEGRRGLLHGVAPSLEHLPLLRILCPRTVVDVGANVGQFSLATLIANPYAQIHAFEPLTAPSDKFIRLFQSDSRVRLFRAAVGREAGQVSMHVSSSDDSSSVLPIGELQAQIFPGTAETGREEVAIGPLSHFVSAEELVGPALLKIDVQGYELAVLEGARDLLSCFDFVYVECSFQPLYEGQAYAHEVISFLAAQGHYLTGAMNAYSFRGKPVMADLLFTKSGQVPSSLPEEREKR